jgi:hypothetical protein
MLLKSLWLGLLLFENKVLTLRPVPKIVFQPFARKDARVVEEARLESV